MACERVDIESQRQPTETKAIRVVAEELGVPFRTVQTWVRRNKHDSNESKKAKNPDVYDTRAILDLQTLIDAGEKFGTIYADPPWPYSNQATRSATDNFYSTMTLENIATLPVAELTADKAHLHLWTTNGFLFESRAILEAWGFTYKSCFVWVKPQMGIGNYWRVSHEFMLLGVKGGLVFADHAQKSWLRHDRIGHSKKPGVVRQIIEKASPGPYLEMFGREIVEGWTVYGNQVKPSLLTKHLISGAIT
jgi:N6-adenosine-specific RNA methylase IME4